MCTFKINILSIVKVVKQCTSSVTVERIAEGKLLLIHFLIFIALTLSVFEELGYSEYSVKCSLI